VTSSFGRSDASPSANVPPGTSGPPASSGSVLRLTRKPLLTDAPDTQPCTALVTVHDIQLSPAPTGSV
jgi:hypothetical protein